MDDEKKKTDLMTEFNRSFNKGDWQRAKVFLAFFTIHYPDDAKMIIDRLTDDQKRKVIFLR